MSEPLTVYQKDQSFVGIRRVRSDRQTIVARLRRVMNTLKSEEEDSYRLRIVQQACKEALDEPSNHEPTPPRFRLHDYVMEEMGCLMDDHLPRYLFYRYRYEMFPKQHTLDDFPPCLQIEPASVCNYRCVFCYQTDEVFTKRTNGHMGMMSLELFRQVIDQAEGRCEAITLASRGEPLLCKDIEAMLAYTRGKFVALKLNTNASLLDENTCHAILEAGVSTLVFSADAASEPAYSRFRVGGTLERVLGNVKRFHEIRVRHYPRSRIITRVSGVKVSGTPELGDMEAVWGDLVDQVAFVKYNPWENTYERPVNDIPTPCSDLWRRMFVWWDGTVNPCDVDYKSTLAVGNVRNRSLRELWQSEAYERLRNQHLGNQRGQCSPCNRCTVV